MQMRMTVLEVDDKLERSARFSAEVGGFGAASTARLEARPVVAEQVNPQKLEQPGRWARRAA